MGECNLGGSVVGPADKCQFSPWDLPFYYYMLIIAKPGNTDKQKQYKGENKYTHTHFCLAAMTGTCFLFLFCAL